MARPSPSAKEPRTPSAMGRAAACSTCSGSTAAGPELVAGFGGAAAEGGVEALAAGAAFDGVGVDDGEAAAHQAIDEIDLRAVQVLQRKWIDDHLDATLLHDLVVFGRLGLQRHTVREP